MSDEWLEADEAAGLLGRTPRQLLRYAESGKIATRRVGRRFQYRRDDVEQLASEVEASDATRRDTGREDVGRALLEVLAAQREVIQLQRELMTARDDIASLRAQLDQEKAKSAKYWRVIEKLQSVAKLKRK